MRAGFIARALTYGLIGALALAVALGAGRSPAKANQQGALSLIARAPLGKLTLAVLAAGLLAYAIWKLAQASIGHGPEGGGQSDAGHRIANLGSGIVYLGFFASAIAVLLGDANGSSGSRAPKHAAAGVLGWPGGTLIVGGAGVVLIVVSIVQAYYGLSGEFEHESKTGQMSAGSRRVFLVLGHVGLVARALVFALIGYFLLRTAIDFNPSKAVGVDGALGAVYRQAYGPWLLGLVAAGVLTFACFSLFEARYRRL